jgi:uncharacterized protein (TIGR02246 family)
MGRIGAVLMVAAVVACDGVRGPDEAGGAAASEAVERRQAGFISAMAERDAGALASYFAEDAVMHLAGRPPIEGRAAIGQLYTRMFGYLRESRFTPSALHVAGAGDMAVVHGETANVFGGPDGTVEYVGKYSMVWRRYGDEWLIALYSVSSNESDG